MSFHPQRFKWTAIAGAATLFAALSVPYVMRWIAEWLQ